jgi:hypothetical protein
MPRVGFEPTIPVFKRAKKVRAVTEVGLRDRVRLVCCEDGWIDLVEEESFGVSNVNSGHLTRYLRISVRTLIAARN